AIVFWAVFKQNGTALTTWAESYTDREIPAEVEPVAKTLGMTQTVTFAKDSVPLTDEQFRVARDASGAVIKTWDYPLYFKNVLKEKLPLAGESMTLISTELAQSINPFWVVVLTPVIVAFWSMLKRRNREPSTTWKIFYGFFITSLSTLVMVAATYACHNGMEKSSMLW